VDEWISENAKMSTITVTNTTDTPVAGETDLRQAVAEARSGDTADKAPPRGRQ
jgi:hypothetical protein